MHGRSRQEVGRESVGLSGPYSPRESVGFRFLMELYEECD